MQSATFDTYDTATISQMESEHDRKAAAKWRVEYVATIRRAAAGPLNAKDFARLKEVRSSLGYPSAKSDTDKSTAIDYLNAGRRLAELDQTGDERAAQALTVKIAAANAAGLDAEAKCDALLKQREPFEATLQAIKVNRDNRARWLARNRDLLEGLSDG